MQSVSVSLKPLILASLIGAAAVSSADVYILNFDYLVTGDLPGGSNIATLTISDIGPDQVQFQLDHNASSAADQFISNIWFNLNPYVTPTLSGQTPSDMFSGGLVASEDGILNASLLFDLNLMFETSFTGNRLDPGESASWVLTGTGINAAAFMSTAGSPPPDGVLAMIHIQGIGPGAEGSGKLAAVPEPASMAALGVGVLALLRRRKAQKG
jgi:hypothetical protein